MEENELPKPKTIKKPMAIPKLEALEVLDIEEREESLEEYEKRIDAIRAQILSELTEIERDVLSIAEDILKKKKYAAEIETERVEKATPIVEKIYSKAIGKFENQKGYTKQAIFAAIQSLEQKKWLITGQRMTKEEILNNPIKRQILSFIEKYPGIHARDPKISEELHITRNPFIKHIAALEAFDLIRSIKVGATLNYFPHDLPDVFDDLAILFQNPIVMDIVKTFIESKNVTLMDLAEKIGVYHRAIQYHIKFLVDHNVLIVRELEDVSTDGEKADSRRKYYSVNIGLLERYNRLFRIPPFSEWIKA
jgi:predicted transcriptional regulator